MNRKAWIKAAGFCCGMAILLGSGGCGSREVTIENDRSGLPPEAVQQLDEMARMKQQMEQQQMQHMMGQMGAPGAGQSDTPQP